jgi:glycosyltransferase involved in cell wall biosynthesis
MLQVAHFTFDIDGRSNSGTARVASELIKELSSNPRIFQTLVHFSHSNEEIYGLPRTKEIIIPLGSSWLFRKRSVAFLIWCIKNRASHGGVVYDVTHWHSSRVLPFFFLFPGKKTVVSLHDVGVRILPNVNTMATRLFYWNLRIFQHRIHKIVAGSKDAMENMEVIGGFRSANLEYNYYGSFFEGLFAEQITDFVVPEKFIVCVSRWQQHKNVEILVKAISLIALNCRDKGIKVILVGKPVGNYDLPSRLIEDLNLRDIFVPLSDLTDQNLAYLYDRALFSVFPSIHEGFGLAVLESMSRGCVPIIHKYTATKEISGDAGIAVDMLSEEDLANRLLFVIENPDIMGHRVIKAIERSRHFTWNRAVEKLISIYVLE